MANSVTVSGMVVTPVHELKTLFDHDYLNFRVKADAGKGSDIFVAVNVYSYTQIKLAKDRGLKKGDRVWVQGELMARMTNDSGHDVIEVRALQLDPVKEV